MSSKTLSRQAGILSRQLARRVALLSLITILALAAVVVVGLVSSLQAAQRQLTEVGSTATGAIDGLLSGIQNDLLTTSDSLALTRDTEETLRRMLNRQSAIFELVLVDPQGQVLAQRRRVGEVKPTVTVQPWLATVEIGGVYIGPVDYGEFGVPFVNIATAVTDEAGNFTATLLAKVDLTTLWEATIGLHAGKTGYVYITDGKGQLLAYRNLQLVQQGATLQDEIGQTPKAIAQAGIKFYTGLGGEPVVASGIPLTTAPWFVIVEQPVSEALRPFAWLSLALMALLVAVGLLVYGFVVFTRRRVASPLLVLREGVDALRQGQLTHRIQIQTSDEFGDLAGTFNTMATQLQQMVSTLEQRVAARTRGLQTAAEVSQATTSVLDPDQLLRQVVDLVRERFNLYYVGLFLVEEGPEPGRKFAVLRAGTGEAGRQMIAQGHRLEVGGDSMIGQCVARAAARIALDVGEEPARFDNPLLPQTRSEMALPLRSRGRVIGAVTVQSVEGAAFTEADTAVMQTMADQVAVAIDNARLFAETQATLKEMEATHQRYLGRAWAEYTALRTISGYEQTYDSVKPLSKALPEVQRVATEGRPVIWGGDGDGGRMAESSSLADAPAQTDGSSALVVPIMLRGQPIGALGLKDKEGKRLWSDEDIALAEAIAEQLALAADNLRLLDETQRRAARERLTIEITDKMRRAASVEGIVQTAVDELFSVLGTSRAFVRLGTTSPAQDDREDK